MKAAEVVAAILSKELDDNLTEIKAAITARQDSGDVVERWQVTFEGEVIDRTTVTIGEAIKFGDMRRNDFRNADPVNSTADRVALVLARLMSKDHTLVTAEQAGKVIDAKPLDAIVVTEYIEVDAPKDR